MLIFTLLLSVAIVVSDDLDCGDLSKISCQDAEKCCREKDDCWKRESYCYNLKAGEIFCQCDTKRSSTAMMVSQFHHAINQFSSVMQKAEGFLAHLKAAIDQAKPSKDSDGDDDDDNVIDPNSSDMLTVKQEIDSFLQSLIDVEKAYANIATQVSNTEPEYLEMRQKIESEMQQAKKRMDEDMQKSKELNTIFRKTMSEKIKELLKVEHDLEAEVEHDQERIDKDLVKCLATSWIPIAGIVVCAVMADDMNKLHDIIKQDKIQIDKIRASISANDHERRQAVLADAKSQVDYYKNQRRHKELQEKKVPLMTRLSIVGGIWTNLTDHRKAVVDTKATLEGQRMLFASDLAARGLNLTNRMVAMGTDTMKAANNEQTKSDLKDKIGRLQTTAESFAQKVKKSKA